jgi:hypothetical protein
VIDDANEYFGAAKIETVGNKIQSWIITKNILKIEYKIWML